MVGYHEEREQTAEINERRKRTIEEIVLENKCDINPFYGLKGIGRSYVLSIYQKNCAGIAGTLFGGILVTVLYVLMPNNNPFLHPEHW